MLYDFVMKYMYFKFSTCNLACTIYLYSKTTRYEIFE